MLITNLSTWCLEILAEEWEVENRNKQLVNLKFILILQNISKRFSTNLISTHIYYVTTLDLLYWK